MNSVHRAQMLQVDIAVLRAVLHREIEQMLRDGVSADKCQEAKCDKSLLGVVNGEEGRSSQRKPPDPQELLKCLVGY